MTFLFNQVQNFEFYDPPQHNISRDRYTCYSISLSFMFICSLQYKYFHVSF